MPMVESLFRFGTRTRTSLWTLISFFVFTASSAVAYDPDQFPGQGSRADFDQAGKISNQANQLGAKGSHQEAVDLYRKAISIYPYAACFYYNLGNHLKRLGDLSAALEAYNQAVKLAPDYSFAWANLGDLFNRQKNYSAAKNACQKALQIDSRDVPSMVNMAEAYLGENKPAEARRLLESANAQPDAETYKKDIAADLAKADAMQQAQAH